MTLGSWRRKLSESARQNLGITSLGRDKFTPTSNSRVVSTFVETKKFAEALRKFDKQTVNHIKNVKGMFNNSEHFLSAPVPRIHAESSPGDVVPTDPESKVGPTVDYDKLKSAPEAGAQRLQTYVLEPLRKWLLNFDKVVIAMQEVEHLRLQLDSRRRSVASLEGKLTNIRSKGLDENDPKLEQCLQKKHRQEMKMNNALEDFRLKEQTTYQNLVSLVHDVKYVQQHVHKLFELHREIYADACEAFIAPRSQHHAPHGERQIPVYSHPGATSEAPYEPDVVPLHSQSDHGPGISASNDAYSYNNRVDGVKPKKQDRYGNLEESGGFYPV